jgi:hypothetical protein
MPVGFASSLSVSAMLINLRGFAYVLCMYFTAIMMRATVARCVYQLGLTVYCLYRISLLYKYSTTLGTLILLLYFVLHNRSTVCAFQQHTAY